MINYDSKRELKAFLEKKGLGMRKKFGQNFLINGTARSMLLDSLDISSGDEVWEVGPGLGAMTAGLIERGARITAFEIDPAFTRILRETFACEIFADEYLANWDNGTNPALRIIEGDVLKTWPLLQVASGKKLYLLGNLPYNIAAALLADFIENGRFFTRAVVTVQKEVAMRMAAVPGSADYSSFSVLCASVYKVSLLKVIKGASFYPEPRVDSRGMLLEPLSPREERPRLFYPLVRALFSSRRKTIRNTLSAFAASGIIGSNPRALTQPKELVADVLCRADISGERRPETLGINEFAALAAYMEDFTVHGS